MRLSLCGERVSLFVWRACVVLFCVARVCCALLSAASARPAGKPPAKRLGKHRASRPSGGGILERKYLNFEVFFFIKKLVILIKIITKDELRLTFQAL